MLETFIFVSEFLNGLHHFDHCISFQPSLTENLILLIAHQESDQHTGQDAPVKTFQVRSNYALDQKEKCVTKVSR